MKELYIKYLNGEPLSIAEQKVIDDWRNNNENRMD
jgi:hypothetical protein